MKQDQHKRAIEVVKAGYNRLADRYAIERERFDNWREVKEYSARLPGNAKVLDVGCGTGVPIARYLTERGCKVTGIDISEAMIDTARKNVPGELFIKMDMTMIDLPPESFDGLISCYAIFHTPRELHGEIFKSFYSVLRPRGVMLVSVASSEWEEFADYLGVDMFWSHYGPDKTESLINEAGFEVEFGYDVESGGETHHWVLACKRTPGNLGG